MQINLLEKIILQLIASFVILMKMTKTLMTSFQAVQCDSNKLIVQDIRSVAGELLARKKVPCRLRKLFYLPNDMHFHTYVFTFFFNSDE